MKVLAKDMPEQPGPRLSAWLVVGALVVTEQLELHHAHRLGSELSVTVTVTPTTTTSIPAEGRRHRERSVTPCCSANRAMRAASGFSDRESRATGHT